MWGWLIGNSDSAGKAVDGVIDSLDALIFTDEEKSIASQKVLDFKIEYAKHTQNQSIARRVIAFVITGVWATLNLFAVTLYFFNESASKFVFDVLKENINVPFMIVVGFYFAAHVVGKLSK